MPRTSSPCHFWRFPSFARGSELCEAQETRGSKFTYEFGRNSTVYCFVASGVKQLPLAKYEIYLTFSKSADILNFFVRVFCSLYFFAYLCYTYKKLRQVIK